jgi:hypothetical protein
MIRRIVLWNCLALLGFIGNAAAQQPQPADGIRLIPSFGSYLPAGDLGFGSDGPNSPAHLNLSRGYAVGLAVEAPLSSIFSLRAGARYGFASEVVAGIRVPCEAGCTAAEYERSSLADASSALFSADLVLRPFGSSMGVQPYLLAGGAYRRHFYDQDLLPSGGASAGAAEQASRWVPHLGLGVEVPVSSLLLRVEADIFGDLELDGWKPAGGRYGDGFLSIGFSWRP